MEGFQRIVDNELFLHQEAAAITATQDGSVATVAKTHFTGPGMFGAGSYLMVNVTSADDADGNETYSVDWLLQKESGGYQTFISSPIPRGTAGQVFLIPVSNRWWDGTAYDECKVALNLGGTTPILDCTVRLCVIGI